MLPTEKKRVLIVDDSDATCALMTAILHKDFGVDAVSDGSEAIDRIRTQNYAVILLDLRMPLVDGFGVLEYLSANHPALLSHVLVVTASLTQRELVRAKRYPICGVITKPFEVEVFLHSVRQCAGEPDGTPLTSVLCSSPAVLLLLADLLRKPW